MYPNPLAATFVRNFLLFFEQFLFCFRGISRSKNFQISIDRKISIDIIHDFGERDQEYPVRRQ